MMPPATLPTSSVEFPSQIGCVDFIAGAGVIITRGMPLGRLADLLSPILGELCHSVVADWTLRMLSVGGPQCPTMSARRN